MSNELEERLDAIFQAVRDFAQDRVAELVRRGGGEVDRAELVGLLPESVLRAVPEDRWTELDLGPTATIEARLAGRGPTTPS